MKALWNYVEQHLSEDFKPITYLLIIIFLVISMTINYTYDLVDGIIHPLKGLTKTCWFFILYAVAYYVASLIIAATQNENSFISKPAFWYKTLLGLLLLSIDSSLPYLRTTIKMFVDPGLQFWVNKVSLNLISFFTILLPLLLIYKSLGDEKTRFYGLSSQHFDKRPYMVMLLMMLPVLIVASFHRSFVQQYPLYKSSGAHLLLNVPEWVTVAIYEIAYGLDFITVELLFRGFLVIGMIEIMGRKAVLAMAVVYCYLHFGKPLGEAIGSIAGGYILGVIAMETRSIWGGIIVHLGIAWLMECIAYLQRVL